MAQSSLPHSIPSDLNGHSITPEHITVHQHNNYTGRKNSKVRLNDQLVPKPTDINMAEKMIKIGIPKEHPYSSHISRFAMFPSFCSPDDPETGVRAASQPFLNPLIPNSAPDITLLSKTIGGPYRHEILESPMKTRKKAVMWAGEHGFFDNSKPLTGENQVFYPTPPKKVLPNPKLREWDLTLCERTSNILKNLDRAHWITSYQLDYTGSGPANPLKIDDFKEKISDLTGMMSHTAQLRERSFPVFVPSKPRKGCLRRQGSCVGRSTCSPTAADPLNQATALNTANQQRPQGITANHNEAPDPNQKGHSQSKYSSGSTEAQSSGLSQEVLHKQQTESKSSVCEGREREKRQVQFDESLMHASVVRSSQEASTAQIRGPENLQDSHKRPHSQGETEVREKSPIEPCAKDEPSGRKEYSKAGRRVSSLGQSAVAKDLSGIESHAELSARAWEPDTLETGRELLSNPGILPRPAVLPGIPPLDRVGAVGREEAALSLLDLQNSFSKSNINHIFNSSVKRAAVNLRDNVVTGKKHDFYGINCYYLHG